MNLTDIPIAEVSRHGGVLAEIIAGQRLGVIVRSVFDPALLAFVVAELERGALTATRVEHYGGRQYGRALVISPDDLTEYFAESQRVRDVFARLFAPAGYEPRIREVLSLLGPGNDVVPPTSRTGEMYGPTTIRVLGQGGAIDLHCENETARFPAMKDLGPRIREQVSFYIPLALPEEGGELHIYGARFDAAAGASLARMDRKRAETIRFAESRGDIVARPGVGDMIIFDAGRYYHRVTPVVGPCARWTMGGFVAPAVDRSALYYWA